MADRFQFDLKDFEPIRHLFRDKEYSQIHPDEIIKLAIECAENKLDKILDHRYEGPKERMKAIDSGYDV